MFPFNSFLLAISLRSTYFILKIFPSYILSTVSFSSHFHSHVTLFLSRYLFLYIFSAAQSTLKLARYSSYAFLLPVLHIFLRLSNLFFILRITLRASSLSLSLSLSSRVIVFPFLTACRSLYLVFCCRD